MAAATNNTTQSDDPTWFDVNRVLESIGYFGRFHWFQLAVLFVVGLSGGIGTTSFSFTGFVPKYRCLVPQVLHLQFMEPYTS